MIGQWSVGVVNECKAGMLVIAGSIIGLVKKFLGSDLTHQTRAKFLYLVHQ